MPDTEQTVVIVVTKHNDDSYTMRYHAPVLTNLLGLLLGPVLAEQLLTAEQMAANLAIVNEGVVVYADGVGPAAGGNHGVA